MNLYYLAKYKTLNLIKKNRFLFNQVKKVRKIIKGEKALVDLFGNKPAGLNHEKSLDLEYYRDFVFLFKLRKFTSAVNVAEKINKENLRDKQLLNLVQCFYCSDRGIHADIILKALIEKAKNNLLDRNATISLFEKIALSGLSSEEKLAILSDFDSQSNLNEAMSEKARLQIIWFIFKIKNASASSQDPLEAIPDFLESAVAYFDWGVRFFPALKQYGHEHIIKAILLKRHESLGLHDVSVIRAFMNYIPEWFDLENIKQFPESIYDNTSILTLAYAKMGQNPVFEEVFSTCLDRQVNKFKKADLLEKDKILRALIQIDHLEQAFKLIDGQGFFNNLISTFLIQGFHYFENGDFYSARDSFLTVLKEDPSDNLAASGLRLSLPRSGSSMKDILNIRSQIGYGLKSGGRTGIRPIGSELTIAHLMSGEYVSGLYSKSYAVHWRKLELCYGPKVLNYKSIPSNCEENSIFVIADEGVGDEIRTAQFYGELCRRFKKVTITCDPRLHSMFSRSFPEIEFIPVQRLRKGVVEEHSVDSNDRLKGIDQKIETYLTENCRTELEAADYITFGQNLFFNQFSGNMHRPENQPYLQQPHLLEERDSADRKLRVGLLWRSHFRSRMRSYMYLDLDEFLPILNIPGVEYWSIQHCIDQSEKVFCKENEIYIEEGIDLFNDFEGLSMFLKGFDLLIGISSVPIELGAALGIDVWMLGFSPENYFLRTAGGKTDLDQYTINSQIVAPPGIDFSASRDECVKRVFDQVRNQLTDRVREGGFR